MATPSTNQNALILRMGYNPTSAKLGEEIAAQAWYLEVTRPVLQFLLRLILSELHLVCGKVDPEEHFELVLFEGLA